MTTYMNVDATNKRVEIGSTWYRRDVQRSPLNMQSKLLLGHLFETLGCIAIEFRTHFFNHASRHGTFIGSLCALIPGTGPTIASFVSYVTEKKISKTPERFGHGAIEGVACPEASTHSSVQGDFMPTTSLGIPGDTVMALLLGALIIHGIVPGPQLISQHTDIFWGLIASFWIGNVLLMVLKVPMIGIWVKLLSIPYRYLYPSAVFFVRKASPLPTMTCSRSTRLW
jgi:TctA family transporter